MTLLSTSTMNSFTDATLFFFFGSRLFHLASFAPFSCLIFLILPLNCFILSSLNNTLTFVTTLMFLLCLDDEPGLIKESTRLADTIPGETREFESAEF